MHHADARKNKNANFRNFSPRAAFNELGLVHSNGLLSRGIPQSRLPQRW
jgi:hypothetical protein